jgi:hypothetical protein
LKQADLVTVLSTENLKLARHIAPDVPSEMVPFGVSLESFPIQPPSGRSPEGSIRIFAPGNDMHRDWTTLTDAVRKDPRLEARVSSRYFPAELLSATTRLELWPTSGLRQVHDLYRWADVVVVPLQQNAHASGITVILEAIASGKAVVCSDTGGLRDYFSEEEVLYAPPYQPDAIRSNVHRLAGNLAWYGDMVKRGQSKICGAGLTSECYAKRHVVLSRQLLGELCPTR